MLKLLLGNAIFATCIGGWYLYCDGERSLLLAGILLAFPCFVSGIFMGYILRTPEKKRRVREPDRAVEAELPDAEMAEQQVAQEDVAEHEAETAGGGEVAVSGEELDAVAHDRAMLDEPVTEPSIPAYASAAPELEHTPAVVEIADGSDRQNGETSVR